MTKDLREELETALRGRTCLVGVGNPDFGDDAFGTRLAEDLIRDGCSDVLAAGANPERFLSRINEGGFEHIVFLDAVEITAEPGSVVWLDALKLKAHYPQVSTHKISLGTLASYLEAQAGARVWLLGVKPASLRPGSGLSACVEKSMQVLRVLLKEIAGRSSGDNCPLPRPEFGADSICLEV